MRVRHILALLSGVLILSGCNDSTAPAPELKTISLVTATLIDADPDTYDEIDRVDLFFGIKGDSNSLNSYTYLHPRYNPQSTFMIMSGEKVSLIAEGFGSTTSDSLRPQPSFRAISDWKTVEADSVSGVRVDPKSIYSFDTRGWKIVNGGWQIDSAMTRKFLFERNGDNTTAEAVVSNSTGAYRYVSSYIRHERIFDCRGSSGITYASTNGLVIAVNKRVTSRLIIPKVRLTCEVYSDMASANMALSALRAGLRR